MFSTSRMAKASSPGVASGLFWQMPAVWLWLYPCTIKPRTASSAVRDMATAGILARPTCWDVCRRRSAAALARSHLQWHRPIQTPHSWHGHSWTRAVRYSAPLWQIRCGELRTDYRLSYISGLLYMDRKKGKIFCYIGEEVVI